MFFRFLSFGVLLILCFSCNKFSFKRNKNLHVLDTIVNFNSVDRYPSFNVCDSIINKEEKSDCFRTTIHKKIGEELLKHKLVIKESINETVYIDLVINAKGVFKLDSVKLSKTILKELPQLDSILRLSVQKLPIILPAIKMGIPVTTRYSLPIKIQLKEEN